MAGVVLCHPSRPHTACRAADTRPSRHLDRPARRVCGAPAERPPRPGSPVAGVSASRRPRDDLRHYSPGFSLNEYFWFNGSILRRDLYAPAAIAGVVLYLLLQARGLPRAWAFVGGMAVVVALRLLAIFW